MDRWNRRSPLSPAGGPFKRSLRGLFLAPAQPKAASEPRVFGRLLLRINLRPRGRRRTLSYVLGRFNAIIYFLIDSCPYVRFHAAQSIVTFGGLHIVRALIGVMFGLGWWYGGFRPFGGYGVGHFAGFGIGITLPVLIGFLTFISWIVCMFKAYQGERFMVPIAGDIAANLAGR